MSHRIRFRGGWTRHDGSTQTKVVLPDRASEPSDSSAEAGSRSAPVRYLRPFNCPTGLDAGTRVDLVIESWHGMLQARLDETPLAGPLSSDAAPLRTDVTPLLRGHHQLTVDLTASDGQLPGLTGIAFLEIDP